MTNEELQTAIDKAVEHYLTLRMKAHSMDHATRDEAHDHLVCLMKEQVQRATKDDVLNVTTSITKLDI